MTTASDLEFAEVDVAPALAVQVAGSCPMNPAEISKAIHGAFETAVGYVAEHGLVMNNQPRVIYTSYDPDRVCFLAALPVVEAAPTEGEGVTVGVLAGVRAYRFTHRGPYPNLAQTYNRITAWMQDRSLMASEADWANYMPMWEEYRNDPETTPPEQLLTYIYLPKG